MDPPFMYTLPTDTYIFRTQTIAKEGRWYTLSLEDAYTYGTNITEYGITKELKLLNITSLTFHYDIIDRPTWNPHTEEDVPPEPWKPQRRHLRKTRKAPKK